MVTSGFAPKFPSVRSHSFLFVWPLFLSFFFFFLYIRPLGHSRQVYTVHPGLQDEGLQVTISNYVGFFNLHRVWLSLHRGPPVKVPIRRKAHFSCHTCKWHEWKRVWTPKIPLPKPGIDPGTFSSRGQCAHHWATMLSFLTLIKTIFLIFSPFISLISIIRNLNFGIPLLILYIFMPQNYVLNYTRRRDWIEINLRWDGLVCGAYTTRRGWFRTKRLGLWTKRLGREIAEWIGGSKNGLRESSWGRNDLLPFRLRVRTLFSHSLFGRYQNINGEIITITIHIIAIFSVNLRVVVVSFDIIMIVIYLVAVLDTITKKRDNNVKFIAIKFSVIWQETQNCRDTFLNYRDNYLAISRQKYATI